MESGPSITLSGPGTPRADQQHPHIHAALTVACAQFSHRFRFRLPAPSGGSWPPCRVEAEVQRGERFAAGGRWSQGSAQSLPSQPSAHSTYPLPALHQLEFIVENRLCPGGKQMRFRLLTIKIIAMRTGQRPAGSQTLRSLTAGGSGVKPRTPTASCGAGLQCPGLAQPAHACAHTHTHPQAA